MVAPAGRHAAHRSAAAATVPRKRRYPPPPRYRRRASRPRGGADAGRRGRDRISWPRTRRATPVGPGGRAARDGRRARRATLGHARVVATDNRTSGPPARFVVPLLGDTRFVATDFPTLAISPDGAIVAYTATRGDRTQLFLRPLNGHEATPVPGSANAVSPFFSPDSQWIAFFADGKLKKMPVAGGPPENVCDATIGFGGTWGSDDTIVFAPAPGSPLWRVPAAGGTPVRLTQLDAERGEFSHRWPEFLPDGRTVLFTIGAYRAAGTTPKSSPSRSTPAAGSGWWTAAPIRVTSPLVTSCMFARIGVGGAVRRRTPERLRIAGPCDSTTSSCRSTALDS